MRMTLSELEFLRLLPQFMRDDAAVKGLSFGLDIVIPQLAESLKHLTTWDQIDNLSEAELDELAWELNILWYDLSADISCKRDVIKNSDKVYQHLGTKWAVENVVNSYFGSGHIKEWFEYDGLPGRFRIHSSNVSITSDKLASFLNMLNKVKRASAKLEAIYIDLETTGGIIYGACGEMAGRMDVWPLVVREIENTSQAVVASAVVYSGTLEIFPQGGQAHG